MAIKIETLQSTIIVEVGFYNLCGKMFVLQKESVLESELICCFPSKLPLKLDQGNWLSQAWILDDESELKSKPL